MAVPRSRQSPNHRRFGRTAAGEKSWPLVSTAVGIFDRFSWPDGSDEE